MTLYQETEETIEVTITSNREKIRRQRLISRPEWPTKLTIIVQTQVPATAQENRKVLPIQYLQRCFGTLSPKVFYHKCGFSAASPCRMSWRRLMIIMRNSHIQKPFFLELCLYLGLFALLSFPYNYRIIGLSAI